MSDFDQAYNPSQTLSVDVPILLRNTYSLLASTILVSAIAAIISTNMALSGKLPASTGLITFIPAIILLWFVIPRTANSIAGVGFTFLFTALMGFGLGPMLASYLGLSNGGTIIAQALGGTAFLFFGLSAYTLITKKDFSFLSGFLMTGALVLIFAVVVSLFIQSTALHLAISCAFMVFSSASILWYTSSAIKGGETNYVLLTVGLYVSIYNIFVSLLSILGIFGGDD